MCNKNYLHLKNKLLNGSVAALEMPWQEKTEEFTRFSIPAGLSVWN